jgi:putative colanic acid biosynthesis glycosyltransferase
MKQVRFTVVTITFNDLPGLRETTDSVKAEDFSDFEWIIVDGGSTDGTLEYLQQLDHPKCRWTSEPDKGIFDAMNKGLDRTTGEYVVFMNSGDAFAGKDVLTRIDAIAGHGEIRPDLIFGDAYEENSSGQRLLKPARSAEAIKRGMFTHHQAMVYAREVIKGLRYDCRFRLAADYHFTCRVLARGASSFYLGFPVCIFKRAGFSESHAEVGRRENLAVQKEVLGLWLGRRAYNYVSYLAAAAMRTYMRGLYDRLRFRHAAPTA